MYIDYLGTVYEKVARVELTIPVENILVFRLSSGGKRGKGVWLRLKKTRNHFVYIESGSLESRELVRRGDTPFNQLKIALLQIGGNVLISP